MDYTDTIRPKRRLVWLNAVFLMIGVAIGIRMVQLQVWQHDRFVKAASVSHSRKYEVPAKRGEIYFWDGDRQTPLVLNQTLKILYADPRLVKDKPATAKKLAAVTGQPVANYLKALERPGEYSVLGNRLPASQGDKISNLKLPGIGLADRSYRTYPEGQLASQLTGFVNADGVGQYGIEGYFNKQLGGQPGLLKAKTDTQGVPIATADNYDKPPVNGSSLILTIDRSIQAQAEQYLKAGVESVKAKSGSVVIIDPRSGAIKAMANFPTYDSNNYSQVKDYGLFANPVVSGAFEPGSGFKIFTMSAGLDSGKVNPGTTYNDTGEVKVKDRTIKNADNHKFGVQTMNDVIQKSLNTGVIFVLKMLGGDAENVNLAGKKVLHEYITKRFGFGLRTGIEQVGESSGVVNPLPGYDANYANMTFGQGINVTMIQMVTAAAAIANGGKLYQPYLIDRIKSADGQTKKTQPRVIRSNVISAQAAKDLTNMMVLVVQHGSGYATKIPGYQVAGKTGTAQIPRPDGQGYEEGKNIGSFVGFAPVNNPRFVMMVRINEPHVSGFAESTTVPVFAQIANWLLRYYAVPPG